jgi:hypothetical protein
LHNKRSCSNCAKQQQANQQTEQKEPETLKTAEPLPTPGMEEKVNVPASELEPPVASESAGQ